MKISDGISLLSKTREKVNRAIISQMAQEDIIGLSTSHGDILNALYQTPQLTMAEIAQRIGKDKSTVTVLVEKLVKQGYVTKERDQSDTRVILVRLTERGESIKPAFERISDQILQQFYGALTAEERAIWTTLMKKIHQAF